MSLMKFLSVSKSFLAEQNQPGRYKITEQGLLPKFAPVGRPVSLAPKRKTDETAQAKGSASKERGRIGSASADEDSHARLSLRKSCERHSPFARMDAESGASAAADPRLAVCVNAVPTSTHWFRLRKNPFASMPVEKSEPTAAVQAELALDRIKPIRNDLSDADFQVVPVGPLKKSDEGKGRRPRLFRPELMGMAWSRLTARLFHSERARV